MKHTLPGVHLRHCRDTAPLLKAEAERCSGLRCVTTQGATVSTVDGSVSGLECFICRLQKRTLTVLAAVLVAVLAAVLAVVLAVVLAAVLAVVLAVVLAAVLDIVLAVVLAAVLAVALAAVLARMYAAKKVALGPFGRWGCTGRNSQVEHRAALHHAVVVRDATTIRAPKHPDDHLCERLLMLAGVVCLPRATQSRRTLSTRLMTHAIKVDTALLAWQALRPTACISSSTNPRQWTLGHRRTGFD